MNPTPTTVRRLAVAVAAASAAVLAAALPAGAAATTVTRPAGGTLSETGSTLLYPLFNLWVPAYHAHFADVTVTTAGTGSGTGITDASDGTADIGASDAYLSPDQRHATPTLQDVPLAISAQLIAYNVPGVTSHLRLDGTTLADIYQGKVTNWDAKAIRDDNPGVTLPHVPIVTLHRSDGSGDTFLFTQYLSDADPSGWGSTVGYGTTVPWPTVSGALAEEGNSGMVSGCKATPGCVAYIGISYEPQILADELGYAALRNGKGQYELPDATTIKAEAAGFADKTPADGAISMVDGKVEGGYPIINYEYAIVNTKQPSPATAQNIRSLLQWVVDPAGGNSPTYLHQVGFQPLPTKVVHASLDQIDKTT